MKRTKRKRQSSRSRNPHRSKFRSTECWERIVGNCLKKRVLESTKSEWFGIRAKDSEPARPVPSDPRKWDKVRREHSSHSREPGARVPRLRRLAQPAYYRAGDRRRIECRGSNCIPHRLRPRRPTPRTSIGVHTSFEPSTETERRSNFSTDAKYQMATATRDGFSPSLTYTVG